MTLFGIRVFGGIIKVRILRKNRFGLGRALNLVMSIFLRKGEGGLRYSGGGHVKSEAGIRAM